MHLILSSPQKIGHGRGHPLLFLAGTHFGASGQPSGLNPEGHSCWLLLQFFGQYASSQPGYFGMQKSPLSQPYLEMNMKKSF